MGVRGVVRLVKWGDGSGQVGQVGVRGVVRLVK